MKKVFTLFAAVMLLSTLSFAQQPVAQRHVKLTKNERVAPVRMALPGTQAAAVNTKDADDPVTVFPWEEGFENGTPAGFTFADADNDGKNWVIKDHTNDYFSTHNGEYVMVSASWDDVTQLALTPDNWMILPAFTLPTDATEYNISWWEVGQDVTYNNENYSVYVSTTGRTVADFTTAVLTSTTTGTWTKKMVDLSSYAGQTIYIAFRHHNVTDMFYLNIDDIRVGGPTVSEVTLYGPDYAETNSPVAFTAEGANTFTWTVDGEALAETGDSISYTFTTTGIHTVIVSATNTAGTGSDTLEVQVFSCDEAIATIPWNEGFEGNTNCWQFLTPDNISNGFRVTSHESYAHTGYSCIIGTYSDDVDVDQWAISPLITLPTGAQNFILKYYALTRVYDGIESHYQVYITTDTNPTLESFVTPLVDETSGNGMYAPHTLSVGAYAGQTIRIAFRNITAQGGDAMFIDDIYIGLPVAPDVIIDGPMTARSEEPVEFHAYTDATSVEWKVNGAVQSTTEATLTYTFTSGGVYTVIASATNAAGTSSDTLEVEIVECNPVELPHSFDLATEYNLCWDNPQEGWDLAEMDDGSVFLYSMSNYYGFMDLNPDNWIYTPSIIMGEGSYEIAWKVMPYTTQLPSDHYGVYLVQGENATLLRQETLRSNITHPSQRAVTIPDGVTGNFKVAFRHYNTTGGYIILLSDIEIVPAGSTVGIDDVNSADVAVYPNPANDVLHIEGEGIQQVEMIDLNGRTVMSAAQAGSLHIGSLAAGVYVVRVVTATGVSTQKIVKK